MKIDLEFNVDTLRISDLDEEESYGNTATQSAGSTLLNSIKQRSTVTPSIDPMTGEVDPQSLQPAPKIKAQIEGTKLRQLINNIPNDDF
jgi:hypothetical protein